MQTVREEPLSFNKHPGLMLKVSLTIFMLVPLRIKLTCFRNRPTIISLVDRYHRLAFAEQTSGALNFPTVRVTMSAVQNVVNEASLHVVAGDCVRDRLFV